MSLSSIFAIAFIVFLCIVAVVFIAGAIVIFRLAKDLDNEDEEADKGNIQS